MVFYTLLCIIRDLNFYASLAITLSQKMIVPFCTPTVLRKFEACSGEYECYIRLLSTVRHWRAETRAMSGSTIQNKAIPTVGLRPRMKNTDTTAGDHEQY
jgi:hypothetical protein